MQLLVQNEILRSKGLNRARACHLPPFHFYRSYLEFCKALPGVEAVFDPFLYYIAGRMGGSEAHSINYTANCAFALSCFGRFAEVRIFEWNILAMRISGLSDGCPLRYDENPKWALIRCTRHDGSGQFEHKVAAEEANQVLLASGLQVPIARDDLFDRKFWYLDQDKVSPNGLAVRCREQGPRTANRSFRGPSKQPFGTRRECLDALVRLIRASHQLRPIAEM